MVETFKFWEDMKNLSKRPKDLKRPDFNENGLHCPLTGHELIPVGYSENNVLKQAGLYCKSCGYLFDSFSDKTYVVV